MTALQSAACPVDAKSFRAERRGLRAQRRQRAAIRAQTCVDRALIVDPLLREEPRGGLRVLGPAWFVVAALCLHAVLLLGAFVPRDLGARPLAYEQPIEVRMVEPRQLEVPSPVAPLQAAPPPAKFLRPPTPLKKVVEVKDLPPPDPVDVALAPTVEPPKEPPRRIIGLSLESTSTAGAGEAFAVGNSRMGQAAAVAEDPTLGDGVGHTYLPPRRTSVYVPPYPATLRGKGLHGEVGLRVDIDAGGKVTAVTVTRASAYAEFNAGASDAATRSTYEPARLDGVAVARSIDITVHFHPND